MLRDDAPCATSQGLMVDIIRQFGTELSAQRLKADGTQPSELRLQEWCGIGNWQEESLVGLDRLDWLGVCPRFLGTWRAAGGSFDNGCCCWTGMFPRRDGNMPVVPTAICIVPRSLTRLVQGAREPGALELGAPGRPVRQAGCLVPRARPRVPPVLRS